jgi:hypothetical protein
MGRFFSLLGLMLIAYTGYLIATQRGADAGVALASPPPLAEPQPTQSKPQTLPPPPAVAAVPRPLPSPAELAIIDEQSQRAISADEVEDRVNAIQQLSLAPTPAAMQTLARVLREAQDPRERSMAVVSLRKLAAFGDASHEIEGILRDAVSDPDQNVAAEARVSYDTLSRGR